jgi:hypothetical protein
MPDMVKQFAKLGEEVYKIKCELEKIAIASGYTGSSTILKDKIAGIEHELKASAITPEHYPNAGTSKDLIANWLDRGWEQAIAANIEKYSVRAVTLDGDKKLESLKKAQEYLRRWIEFLEGK